MSSSTLQAFSNVYYTTTVVFKYLLDSYCHCRAQTGIAKHLLAFDSHCGGRTGITKRVLVFNSLYGARTEARECLLAFDSLWTGLVIVASNVYTVFVELCYYRSNFQTIPLIVETLPSFPGKIVS